MITLEDIRKSYDAGATWAVNGVSVSVPEGALLALIGESGCGKTTTLKMVNRLVEPTSGAITVGGESIAGLDPVDLRRRIGYVFQGIGLFPHYTVGENIAAVPRLLGWGPSDIRTRVEEMLDLVGLPFDEYHERLPAALSGGQRQRVGVARALAARPRVMLLDEPFGALDPVTRGELQDECKRIQKAIGLTAILVTHDMTEALLMADYIAVMKGGEVLQVGTPHELLTAPEDPYVQTLVEMPRARADRIEALLDAAEAGS
jgi:osmoprotectant transport system ATP-binding protein